MSIKARFWVTKVEKAVVSGGALTGSVHLAAVNRVTTDNEEWAKYTPSGSLVMHVHEEALTAFESLLGKDVYLTIDPVE